VEEIVTNKVQCYTVKNNKFLGKKLEKILYSLRK